jgi:ribosome modulation factor
VSAYLQAFGMCAGFLAVGVALGRMVRRDRLEAARHEGWMAGHAEGHRKTMAAYDAEAAVDQARHEGWMAGFDRAASIKLGVFDREAGR